MKWPWRAKRPRLDALNEAASNSKNVPQNADIVIAIMGVTGVGKSSFIATVTGREDIIGHDLYSETSGVNAYRVSHGPNNYVLVDTPGFNDSSMSNEEVTSKILQWLQLSYCGGTRLSGIIYIHNITNPRMQGSAGKYMRLFRQLCGEDAFGNVILATSFWDQVPLSLGAKRESQLKEEFWADMIAKGSEVVRIKRDRSVCLEVLGRIAVKNRVDLLFQREMIVEHKELKDTAVGKNAMSNKIQEFQKTLEKEKKAEQKRLQSKLEEGDKAYKEEMKKLQAQQKEDQRQEQERQRRAEKEHKRNVREDQRQMKQELRRVKEALQQTNLTSEDNLHVFMNCLYLLACFWNLLVTALVGNVINDAPEGAPSQINFCMFVAVVLWLVSIFGLIASCTESMHKARITTDAIAILFIFIAAMVLSSDLGVHSCFNEDYTSMNDIITGSFNLSKRCQELQACAAFFWFLFVTYCVELGTNVISWNQTGQDSRRIQMSQV